MFIRHLYTGLQNLIGVDIEMFNNLDNLDLRTILAGKEK